MRKTILGIIVLFLASTSLAKDKPVVLFDTDYSVEVSKVEVVSANFPQYTKMERVIINQEALSGDEFIIPIDGIEHLAKLESREMRSQDSFAWRGKVGDSPFTTTLTFYEGLVAGSIWTKVGLYHQNYEILSIHGNEYFSTRDSGYEFEEIVISSTECVAEILKPALLESEVSQVETPTNESRSTYRRRPVSRRTPDPGPYPCQKAKNQIDMLYVYDTTALEKLGGHNQVKVYAHIAVDAINSALQDSLVFDTYVYLLDVVAIDYTSTYLIHRNLNYDMAYLRQVPEAVALREKYEADIFGMIVAAGGGIAYPGLEKSGQAEPIYGTHVASIGIETSIHEFGHNLGMFHNPEEYVQNQSEFKYPYSFAHGVHGRFRTAVAYGSACFLEEKCTTDIGTCTGNCVPVPIFSNPDVIVDGHATGIADERDNARMAEVAIPIVSEFFPGSRECK